MTHRHEDDYWRDLSGPSDGGSVSPALTVETIEGVEPLDDQFGVAEPLNVPPALRDALFGQSDLIEGRAILPLHTYAILDAAKVPGLPEMLDASGLDHACLFQGKAAEELRDVAPWIVRLEENHSLTRGLFTRGDGPHQLWDAEPGIYLRSQADLDELRRHLRKFTKVRDEAGKWFYFRFWEQHALTALVNGRNDDRSLIISILSSINGRSQHLMVIDTATDSAICLNSPVINRRPSAPSRLGAETLATLGDAMRGRMMHQEAAAALALLPQDQVGDRISPSDLGELWMRLRDTGFMEPKDRIQAITLYLQYYVANRHAEAWAVLSEPGPGPGIRLWRLSQGLSEQL